MAVHPAGSVSGRQPGTPWRLALQANVQGCTEWHQKPASSRLSRGPGTGTAAGSVLSFQTRLPSARPTQCSSKSVNILRTRIHGASE